MSKRLTKISIMILTLVFAFCLSVAMIGVARADGTLHQAESFKMIQSVQVRQNGEMGLRFAAEMTADDYAKIKDVEGIEFGMILAPTDWLDSAEDLKFDNPNLPEYVDGGTNPAKYFAKGTNFFIQDEDNYDKDTDTSEYILYASFVGIRPSNYSRTFTAKAYYKVDGQEPVYSDAVKVNIFELMSKYVATTEFEEEVEGENAVKTYVYGVVDKVLEYYDDITVTVDGITDGVAYRDDQVSVTATVSNGTRELKAGTKVALMKDDAEAEGLVYDYETGKYSFATSGIFKFKTTIGNYVKDSDLTIKRHGVQLSDTPNITLLDFAAANYISGKGQFYNIRGAVRFTDDENESAESDTVYSIKDYDAATSWMYVDGSYPSYVILKNGGTATSDMGDETVVVSYTDHYGVTYSYEHVFEAPKFVAKGAADSDIATDAIEAQFGPIVTLNINNVPLTDGTTDLIRFAFNKNVSAYRTRTFKMIITDANDPTNYVYLYMSTENGTYSASYTYANMHIGMKPAKWSKYYGINAIGGTTLKQYKMGNSWSDYGLAGRFIGNMITNNANKDLMDAEKYNYGMIGVSIVNSEMFLTLTNDAKKAPQQVNLCPASMQDATVSSEWTETAGKWTEFQGVESVNIKITDSTGALLIDTLGGQKVTSDMLSKVSLTFKKV